MTAALLAAAVLVQQEAPDRASEPRVGWTLVVVALLLVAVVLLYRSMRKHVAKVPRSFDPPPGETTPPGGAARGDAGTPGEDGPLPPR